MPKSSDLNVFCDNLGETFGLRSEELLVQKIWVQYLYRGRDKKQGEQMQMRADKRAIGECAECCIDGT